MARDRIDRLELAPIPLGGTDVDDHGIRTRAEFVDDPRVGDRSRGPW
jgi:hypothetical protein